MKNLLEKIKENKLRSILVGISAFLFGFISVSIFNNIGDTYALEYNCPSGWKYIRDGKCCPDINSVSDWTYSSGSNTCQASGVAENNCKAYFSGSQTDYYGGAASNCVVTAKTASIKMGTNGCYAGWSPSDKDDTWCCPSGWNSYSDNGEIKCEKYIERSECKSQGYSYNLGMCNTDAIKRSGSSKTITATFIGNGGTVKNVTPSYSGVTTQGYKTCTLAEGRTLCSLPTPEATATREGYVFHGWGTNKNCTQGYRISNISSDKTYYACWQEVKKECYLCGGTQYAEYKWGSFSNDSSCRLEKTYTTQGTCEGNNIKTFSAHFNANGGTLNGDTTVSCTTLPGNPGKCVVTSPTGSKSGYYLAGWGKSVAACNNGIYSKVTSSNQFTLSSEYSGELSACWIKEPVNSGNYNNVTTPPTDGSTGETITVTTREFYTITYDTNGGAFLDGTTTRITIVPSNEMIGEFEAYPIKSGYKFKEWQLNGTKFNFEQKPTANITLKAVYESLTEEDKKYYCKNEKHILEPTSKLCYDVLKPTSNICNYDSNDTQQKYNFTIYDYDSKSTFCWGASADKDGGVFFNVKTADRVCGKDNAPYEGYNKQDSWVSEDTCKIASKCNVVNNGEVYAKGCKVRWDALIYSTTLAEIKKEEFKEDEIKEPELDILEPELPDDKEEPTPEIPDPKPEQPDDGDKTPSDGDGKGEGTGKDEDTDKEPTNDKTDQEITENEKTGTAMIIIAWLVGLSALGYSSYYFIRKNRENN